MASRGYVGCVFTVLSPRHILVMTAERSGLVEAKEFMDDVPRILEAAVDHRYEFFEPMDIITPES